MENRILIEHDPKTRYALLKRIGKDIPQPYVVPWAYDESDGTWGQGHYFDTLEEALSYYRAKTDSDGAAAREAEDRDLRRRFVEALEGIQYELNTIRGYGIPKR